MQKFSKSRTWGSAARIVGMIGCTVIIAGMGCGAFNPAFLNLLDVNGTGDFITIQNAPGHVVVSFINNAEVSERLVSYLESPDGGGLELTDSEKRSLRPRLRFRLEVTFENGTTQEIEFISGSSNLIDPRLEANAFPDLNQNDLNNVVMICDVQQVQLLPGSVIEVFIPVEIEEWEQRIINTAQQQTIEWVEDGVIPAQFRQLQIDDVDADGNTILRRNIGVRDVPAPIDNVLCGSVISVIVTGQLEVPFLANQSNDPSYDQNDINVEAGIGGRFEFTMTAQ